MPDSKKHKIVVKKAVAKKKAVHKIVVHDPEPVVEVTVHDEVVAKDPTFIERIQTWLKENFLMEG